MVQLKHQLLTFSSPLVVGIVNVTPDSFATHCLSLNETDILSECDRLLNEGADWLDIGACSTRPGAAPVPQQEEIRRLHIALSTIRNHYPNLTLSVDTFRSQVASQVIEQYDVDMINDVSGLNDPTMLPLLARTHIPYILTYPGEPGAPMLAFFAHQLNRLHQAGVQDVIIDPGIGFGKTHSQNYETLRQLPLLHTLNRPILIGLSRKSMIYHTLLNTPAEALNGTTAAHMIALINGANILRVHDVKQAKETIQIWKEYSR